MSIAGAMNAQTRLLGTSSQQPSEEPYPSAWVAPNEMATMTTGKPKKQKKKTSSF